MKKKNYKNRKYANKRKTNKKQNINNNLKLFSNDLLDRTLLIKGDLEHLDKTIKELPIYQILSPDVLKEKVKFIVKSIAKNCDKYSKDALYRKLFKERIPIYKQEVQLKEIIADSIQLLNVLSVAWEKEEKKFIAQWLIYLQDNIQKIKLIVLALEQCINQFDEQLDFHFQIKNQSEMLVTYIHQILIEYCSNYNLHLTEA